MSRIARIADMGDLAGAQVVPQGRKTVIAFAADGAVGEHAIPFAVECSSGPARNAKSITSMSMILMPFLPFRATAAFRNAGR